MKTLLSKWKPNRKVWKFLKNIMIGIGIVLFLSFLALPFCRFSDDVMRIFRWIWLGCAVINLDNFAEYKTAKEQKIICPVTTLYVILTCIYLYTYWDLLSLPTVIFGSMVVGVAEFTLSVSIYKTIRFTDKQKSMEFSPKIVRGIQLGGLYICSLALFLLGVFESTILLYIFGGIALVLLAVSILISLSNGLFVKENIFNLIAFVVDTLSFLALITYLIYDIPKEFSNLQSNITTIVSAVLGGAITLVGVAWTIKKTDSDRREDIIAQYTPYLKLISEDCQTTLECQYCQSDSDGKYFIQIDPFMIKNVSEKIVIIEGIYIDDIFFCCNGNFLCANEAVKILITPIYLDSLLSKIKILCSDVLKNKYTLPCVYDYQEKKIVPGKYFVEYEIKRIDLPKLQEK